MITCEMVSQETTIHRTFKLFGDFVVDVSRKRQTAEEISKSGGVVLIWSKSKVLKVVLLAI